MVRQAGSHRFAALDSWRGIAALLVAFYHIQGTNGLVAADWHASLGLAVDFFFVLSGFVIAAAYADRLAAGFPAGVFLWLRVGRIWPVHGAMLTLYVLIECAIGAMGATHGGNLPFTATRDPLALAASVVLVQALVFPAQYYWVVQSWSISVEWALYLLAAPALRWLGRNGAVALFTLAGVAVLLVQHFAPELIWPQVWAARGLGGFGLGMGAWWLWQWRLAATFDDSAASPLLFRGGAGGGVSPSFVAPGATPLSQPSPLKGRGLWRFLPRRATALEAALVVAAMAVMVVYPPLIVADAVFAGLVLAFAAGAGALSGMLLRAPFVMLGTVSYSLYLVHGFVLGRCFDLIEWAARASGTTLTGETVDHISMLAMPGWAANLATLAMLVVAVLAAKGVFRVIEDPARKWSREQVPEWTGVFTR